MSYYTRLYNWSTHSDYIVSMIKEFHIFGHGIELGMSEEEHLDRVLNYANNHSALILYSGDEPIGIATVCPELQRDPHLPGVSLWVSFTVVLPGHQGACLKLYRDLKQLAVINKADWLCTSKRTGPCTYTTRGHKI